MITRKSTRAVPLFPFMFFFEILNPGANDNDHMIRSTILAEERGGAQEPGGLLGGLLLLPWVLDLGTAHYHCRCCLIIYSIISYK